MCDGNCKCKEQEQQQQNNTSEEHFELFSKAADWFLNYFGMSDWSVYYRHEDWNGSKAWCEWDLENRVAGIALAVDWDNYEITQQRLMKCAFHEVWELLLSEFQFGLHRNKVDHSEICAMSHKLIRRMENLYFPLLLEMFGGFEEIEEQE